MSIRVVADTHALLWYLYDDERLSGVARQAMDDAGARWGQIGISSIALVEVLYLVEKGRISPDSLDRIIEVLERPAAALAEIPVDRHVALAMRRIDRPRVPDLPDRIVAATALCLGVPLISRDRRIRIAPLTTIW